MFLNIFEFKSNYLKQKLALFANSKLEFISGPDVIQIFQIAFHNYENVWPTVSYLIKLCYRQ